MLIIERDNRRHIVLVDSFEAYSACSDYLMEPTENGKVLLNSAIIRPQMNVSGKFELSYQSSGAGVEGLEEELAQKTLQAELLIGLLYTGVAELNNLNKKQWEIIKQYTDQMNPPDLEALKTSLTNHLGKTNPKLLEKIEKHLFKGEIPAK